MGIKENWEKVDEVCPNCNQVTKRQKGITRQNIKRLFSFKMNFNEVIILFMLIMVLVLAYTYKAEVKQAQDWINDMYSGNVSVCKSQCNVRCDGIYGAIQNSTNKTAYVFVPPNITLSD